MRPHGPWYFGVASALCSNLACSRGFESRINPGGSFLIEEHRDLSVPEVGSSPSPERDAPKRKVSGGAAGRTTYVDPSVTIRYLKFVASLARSRRDFT